MQKNFGPLPEQMNHHKHNHQQTKIDLRKHHKQYTVYGLYAGLKKILLKNIKSNNSTFWQSNL
ncbi:hypothetical protein DSUL_60172 [Desulfovibrionales bacterium]